MLSVSNEGTANLPKTIMSYSYDNVGNVLSMIDTINGSLGITTTREYDALNRLTVNAQGNKRVDYAYNAINQVINKYRYSDNNLVAETNNTYDNLNRLTNITHSNGTGAIASYSQTYDQGDRITDVTSNDGSSSYTYDDTNQLVSGEYDFQDNESYSYDSNGNRTNDGYVTGVNNRLLEDNKYLYEYDIVGNRTKRTDKSTNEVMEYRWDIRDRLTGITVKNDLGEIIRTAEYTYDVYNQRIAKTVDTDGDGSLAAVTERYVYGRDQNIDLIFDENGNVNHRYLFGNGVDQIEADESNGNVRWALTDHLGSVRDIVDDSGTMLNHIVYDAFGGVTSQTDESVVFRYGYTARELDAESGLQYNRARYLDSFTGKFISEDPISFKGEDTNLYRYVFNSPIGYNDPSGLAGVRAAVVGVRAAVAGAKAIGSGSGLLSGLALIGRFVAPVAAFATTFFAFTQPTADDDYFPSNPQASKNIKPAPTPSPSPKLTPIPQANKKRNPNPFPTPNKPYIPNPNICEEDDPKGENQMIVQLQKGYTNTHQVPVRNNSIVGVRVSQMNNALLELFYTYPTKAPWFPKENETSFIRGMSEITQYMATVQSNGGTDDRARTLYTYQWDGTGENIAKGSPDKDNKRREYRVELENKRGRNLRSF
ncbi:RHS repeat domain-containing protein [Pseudanabaena sp. 'Roaring Creek']|uniref:RHS repeat domain-containing protein n=1 Tax=Pseudanabaena sp. 'Roaring Creek' TaxID=1681830 RepID=UPI0006D85DB5|nr:RHS repeat-associated core domain-containing protein [Pseudanabaena sp. 'Roaring Creek']